MSGDTIHTIPVNDLIEHDTSGEQECICGPRHEPVFREDGSNGWVVIHHSLDGREAHEMPDTAHLERRHMLGVRWGWIKDVICAVRGHVPSMSNSVEWAGEWRPVCTRCGMSVPSQQEEGRDQC